MRRGLAVGIGTYALLLAVHGPLLGLPYFWDEAGYFVPAGLDFFRHGWLIPHATLPNGHPPLLAIYLSGAWLLGGFHPWVTRAAMLVWAAALLLGVERLARPRLGRLSFVPAVLLGVAPLVFAQSTLAQLDLPVAALIVWALVALGGERAWLAAACFTAACLVKETAVIAPLAVLGLGVMDTGPRRRVLPMLMPVAAVAAWFLYYHHVTGYWFGNPQFFAYNVGQASFSPGRIGLALVRRVWQLAFYDGTGALTVLALVAVWQRGRGRGARSGKQALLPRTSVPRASLPRTWLAIVVVYVVFHAVVGGAVLARYLLPALALYFIWLSEALVELRHVAVWVGVCAAVLVTSWFWNPPYPFPYEDNLAYVTFVQLHVQAAREWERHPPAGAIWTAWPASDELTRPDLGYVRHPLAVHGLDDFSGPSLAQVTEGTGALYLYSQIYQPRHDLDAWLPFWSSWSRHFFHFEPPVEPQAWLQRSHLQAWSVTKRAGQWVVLAR